MPVGMRGTTSDDSSSDVGSAAASDVAIIGGGITGLTAAFQLSLARPSTRITIFEAGPRLGGWVNSSFVDVADGRVLLEQGPRTLRGSSPAGRVTLDLIGKLGLEEDIITTPKTAAAARNRYIYYPDHPVRLPGPGDGIFSLVYNLAFEPIFQGLVPGIVNELRRPARPASVEDESIASFVGRRSHPALADNILSAVMHGIYAGDIDQLSARSLFPGLWHVEREADGVLRGLAARRMEQLVEAGEVADMLEFPAQPELRAAKEASVFSFKAGLGSLVQRLEQRLRQNANVRIVTGRSVSRISHDGQSGGVTLSAVDQQPQSFSHVVATVPARRLAALSEAALPTLAQQHAVTVAVVNLYYAEPDLLPLRGFGYLIPRSVPLRQNPERALGVVFDSDAVTGQDSVAGSKVTVMLGGHWWDGWPAYPDEDEAQLMARRVLERHLGIGAEPALVRVGLQRECIPQYTVGHDDRMRQAQRALKAHFRGRVRLAGASYGGVGVNDCVRSGRDVAKGLVDGSEELTGLEDYWRAKRYV